jgi:hypothetical protein
MKKLLYTFLAVSIIFAACKKEDDNTSNTGNTITELEQILLAGENSVLWTITYDESEHREGYILNGIKTYTDITAPLEIDSSGNNQFRFYDSGNIDYIEDGVLISDISLTYEIINENRIELEGIVFGFLPLWIQWDITSKTDSKIEFIYDDFYPGPAGSNDTAWFDCDQGRTIIEKIP